MKLRFGIVFALLAVLVVGANVGGSGQVKAQFGFCKGYGFCNPPVSGGGAFSLTYEASGLSTNTSSTTQSYGSLTLGTGCTSWINGIEYYQNNPTSTSVTAKTDNGVSASAISGAKILNGNAGGYALDGWQVTSPSGTSGAVSVTYGAVPSYNQSVAVYCLISAHPTPGTAATAQTSSNATTLSVTVTVPSGGTAIVMGMTNIGTAITWVNATQDAVFTAGGTFQSFAHTTSTGSVTVTANLGSADGIILSAIPFGP
jgi:hypothetical protein